MFLRFQYANKLFQLILAPVSVFVGDCGSKFYKKIPLLSSLHLELHPVLRRAKAAIEKERHQRKIMAMEFQGAETEKAKRD